MKRYQVVSEWDITSLEEAVNKQIENGWLAQGGVSVAFVEWGNTGPVLVFSQAMFWARQEVMERLDMANDYRIKPKSLEWWCNIDKNGYPDGRTYGSYNHANLCCKEGERTVHMIEVQDE